MLNRNLQSSPNSITSSSITKSSPKGKGKEHPPEDAVHSSGGYSRIFGSSSPQRASSSPHEANSSAARPRAPHTPSTSTNQPKVSESPPSPSPDEITGARRRPRADKADLQMPQPESHPSMYTNERVGKSIEYVNQRLGSKMRKPSPIQEKALLVYKGACQDYLEARKGILPEGRKKEMLSEIRQYEIEV